MICLHSFTLSISSLGISILTIFRVLLSNLNAFCEIIFTTPIKLSSFPIGYSIGTTPIPNFSFICSNVLSKSAFSLSILFIKNALGRFILLQYFHAFSAPTSTPDTAHTTIVAISIAFIPCIISPSKSKYPGISTILIFVLLDSTQAIEVDKEIPLFFSSTS